MEFKEHQDLNSPENDAEEKKKKNRFYIPKKLFLATTGLLLLSSLVNYFLFSSIPRFRKENKDLSSINVSYSQKIQSLERDIGYLKGLNAQGIAVLNEKVDELQKDPTFVAKEKEVTDAVEKKWKEMGW